MSTTTVATRSQKITTLFFALMILVPSFLAFGNKFLEFIAIYRGDVDGVFAITPIVNYLLTSVGFFCLFCWAIANGMFRDVEQPKTAFFERERMLDEDE